MYTQAGEGLKVIKHPRRGQPAMKRLHCDGRLERLTWDGRHGDGIALQVGGAPAHSSRDTSAALVPGRGPLSLLAHAALTVSARALRH
jgi:hypothetical protein